MLKEEGVEYYYILFLRTVIVVGVGKEIFVTSVLTDEIVDAHLDVLLIMIITL